MALTLMLGMTSFASAEQVETIEVAYMLTMNAAEQRDMVQEELNRLLDEKGAGFHVNLVCIDFASWSTQVNLMLTDDSVDLFNCSFMPAMSVLADSGSLAPLDDLLATYGQVGRTGLALPWERTNKVQELQEYVMRLTGNRN